MIAAIAFAVLFAAGLLTVPTLPGIDKAGYVFTIGSAVVLVEVFIATWFTAGLALHPDQLGSATARTITDIAMMRGPILTAADIMVAVPILLAANDGRFPRWLGILAAVFAVEQLIETVTIIGPPASFISPGGPMNIYLGGPHFIVFFLALGVRCPWSSRRRMRNSRGGRGLGRICLSHDLTALPIS